MGPLVIIILALVFFRSPIAHAIADNMRKQGGGGTPDRALAGQVEALRVELQDVRADVTELAERLDFTERMLADVRQRGALPR